MGRGTGEGRVTEATANDSFRVKGGDICRMVRKCTLEMGDLVFL